MVWICSKKKVMWGKRKKDWVLRRSKLMWNDRVREKLKEKRWCEKKTL